MAGYDKCMFNFLRNYQIVLESDCFILHFQQLYMKLERKWNPHQYPQKNGSSYQKPNVHITKNFFLNIFQFFITYK